MQQLTRAYANVLTELLESKLPRVRLLPISSAVFAGPFESFMPHMTLQALAGAFEGLPAEKQDTILAIPQIKMCIFVDKQLPLFRAAQSDLCAEECQSA